MGKRIAIQNCRYGYCEANQCLYKRKSTEEIAKECSISVAEVEEILK